MRAIIKRLVHLEDRIRTAQDQQRLVVQFGHMTELPHNYTGERHVVTAGRLRDGLYQWEERPGRGLEEISAERQILRVCFVSAKGKEMKGKSGNENATTATDRETLGHL